MIRNIIIAWLVLQVPLGILVGQFIRFGMGGDDA